MNFQSYDKLYEHLLSINFPFEKLFQHPISSIETMATSRLGKFHGACNLGCLACCADAVHPKEGENELTLLSVQQFSKFLNFVEFLANKGFDILSVGRLNLFSASNELDHPEANNFRALLSDYMVKRYGVSLGHLASDLVFHVSSSKVFMRNLEYAISKQSMMWDNVCIAIDEQIPFKNKKHYSSYLEALNNVWRILKPALTSELTHSKLERIGQPRVILNFLTPDTSDTYREEYRYLYPSGPIRASSIEELIERYVTPFVGYVIPVDEKIPLGHKYTTGISRFSNLDNAKIYIANCKYSNQGRGNIFINFNKTHIGYPDSFIHTKMLPVDDARIQIQASFSSSFYAEDEISHESIVFPEWMNDMNNIFINISNDSFSK